MRVFLTIVILFNFFFLNAQQNDSLVTIDFNNGKQQLFYRNFDKSIQLFSKALEHYKASKNHHKIAETYNLLSQAHHFLGSREAMPYAQKALTISRQINVKNKLEEANALDNIGAIQYSSRTYKEAQQKHEDALKIRLKYFKNDHHGLANTYYKLGQILRAQQDYNSSLEYLNKALNTKLDSTSKSTLLIANIYESIGFTNYDLSNFDEALRNFEITSDLAKKIYKKDNSYFVDAYNNLGLVYSIKEQFNESLKYNQKALSISITNYGLDRHPSQAMINFNMGTIYRRQNQKSKALYHTQKSLDMALMVFGENHTNLFFPYSQMGQIYNNEKGVPYIMKALKICENSDNNEDLRISYLYDYLNEAYTNIGDYSQATNYAKKALKIRESLFGENNVNTIRSHNNVSKNYSVLKDYKIALHHINKAINLNYLEKDQHNILTKAIKLTNYLDDDLLLESIKIKADIYSDLFKKEGEKEQLKESSLLYQKAASLIDIKRNKKRNYEDKIKFSDITKSIYAKSIETQLLLGAFKDHKTSIDDLFYISEKSRANVLRELAKNTNIKKVSNVDTNVLELEKQLNLDIAKLTSKVVNEISGKQTDSLKVIALEGALFDATQSKDSLEKEIEASFPKYYNLKYKKDIIKVSNLQERLDETTTLLEFFSSNETIYAFIITRNTINIEELSIEGLNKHIQKFNQSIVQKEQVNYLNEAQHLYTTLIKPIEKYFVGDKLIIVPDESLWHLQFDLLVNSKAIKATKKPHYLLFDYAISYANSASMLFENSERDTDSELLNECIAFSYTNKDSTLASLGVDLPGSRKEIEELSTIFKGKYFSDSISNESNFKRYVDQYKLVHLALHADIDSLDPKSLKIRFSNAEQATEEDNILFGHELYALNIPADLVVLSACNTGVGKVNKGEGILSIGNAFQYAGAESLLLSKWGISDETTPKVMKLFYKNIKSGMDKSKALQQAKIDYLNTTNVLTSPTVYWGGFYLLGNTDPIKLNNNPTLLYYGIGTFLMLLIGVFIVRRKNVAA